MFNKIYPNNNINHKYIIELVTKSIEINSINNKRIDERVLNAVTQVEFLGTFTHYSKRSINVSLNSKESIKAKYSTPLSIKY